MSTGIGEAATATDWPSQRSAVRFEYERARETFHDLVNTASESDLGRPSNGTRWTNRQMLFHMMFGYMVARALLPLVKLVSRLPAGIGRRYAALLDAATRPFNAVNYWGSVAGALFYRGDRMAAKFDVVIAALERRLSREGSEAITRSMAFPTRWDPFFTDVMALAALYRYPTQHFEFHRRQLTLDGDNEGSGRRRAFEGGDPTMSERDTDIKAAVRDHYAKAARAAEGCCGPTGAADDLIGRTLYGDDATEILPEGALAASLGCGNPTLLADLHPGQVVLDLGSGGGIDVLLSARRVAPSGKAYGLDMTPEMLELARRNQTEAQVENAEFLEGTMEAIPLPDGAIDVIVSNFVVNLSSDKSAVFSEAFRVLKPGGRLAISDIVLRRDLPDPVTAAMGLWTGCVTGALLEDDYADQLAVAGFEQIGIETVHIFDRADITRMADDLQLSGDSPATLDVGATINELGGAIMSAFVRARKPQ